MSLKSLFLIVFLLSVKCFFLASVTHRYQTPKRVLVIEDEPANCDNRDYALKVGKMSYARNGSVAIMTGDVTVQRDLESPINVIIRIEKCLDKGNPDSCEYYTTWRLDNLCSKTKLIPFLEDYLISTNPPATCLMKKNHYTIKEQINPDLFVLMLGNGKDRYLWKMQFIGKDSKEEQLFVCIKLSIRVAKIRSRS